MFLSRLVPADGVKGKTWGPSTLHQRERGAIITQPPNPASPGGKRWSRSAPDLEKTPLRTALLASAQRSPLLQEIGNPTSRKLYSSANNLIDDQAARSADYELLRIPSADTECREDGNDNEPVTSRVTNLRDTSFNETYESYDFKDAGRRAKPNLKTHFSEELSLVSHGYSKSNVTTAAGELSSKSSPMIKSQKQPILPEPTNDYPSSSSSNFVHSVASSLVGTAKRVRNKKRERSKSKESSKRRDSSESRLNALADFFRSPSGSRKGSLNSARSSERKNSVTIKINDADGLESSPENSIIKPSRHKSRSSKSPLRVLEKIRAWGSRDALDCKIAPAKVEYRVLEDSVTVQKLDYSSNEQRDYTPRFLAANSREGIDFENIECDLCNLDSEHSNDSSKSKSSMRFLEEFEQIGPRSSLDSTRSKSSAASKQSGRYSDQEFDINESSDQKIKSNEYLGDETEKDNNSDAIESFNERLAESLRMVSLSRRSSEGASSASSVSSNILATEKFFRKSD